ncbi:MAG: hypothetical protein AW07_03903 [Candidatus Accumulibacter sp. SK-11]|nr:MAG: hypothetical protein AW07_03903 [Candidatus Accumulibacter sp. SK-11]
MKGAVADPSPRCAARRGGRESPQLRGTRPAAAFTNPPRRSRRFSAICCWNEEFSVLSPKFPRNSNGRDSRLEASFLIHACVAPPTTPAARR